MSTNQNNPNILGVPNILGTTDTLGTIDQPQLQNAEEQLAMSVVPRAGQLIAKGKKAWDLFNNSPLGKGLKKSKPVRQRESIVKDRIGIARERAEKEKAKAKLGSIDIWGSLPDGVTSGWGNTGGSGGGTASSTAEAEYNAAQGGPSDTSTGSQSFSGSAADGWGSTGGSGGGDAESQAEADFNAGQGGTSDSSTGSASFSGAASDFGMEGLGSDWGLPVVLDLDGDGYEIVPLSRSTARFDIAGTGRRQVLAWVGPDDGLLVYDRDGDRLISEKEEIAFKDYLANARTDLEGLAWFDQLAQGGNEDGVLDERDAAWSKFGVWQDVDQDGETDPGELRMTSEGGLQSVNLTSDRQPVDAGPDARIFGTGTYEYLDQNGVAQTADLYDTALRHENQQETDEPVYSDEEIDAYWVSRGIPDIQEYYPIPWNPTLRDLLYHNISVEKGYGPK